MRGVSAGPAAFYLYSNLAISKETSQYLYALVQSLKQNSPLVVRDVILGYTSILLEHDPAADQAGLMAWALGQNTEVKPLTFTHHDIEVNYGVQADKEALEAKLGLPWSEIIALHQAATYTVAFIGFTPGFPYLLGLPRALQLPRRQKPRMHIPSGAVAIAGEQAGIYPRSSPGGWWVLGQTHHQLFDAERSPPSRLHPGDTLRFKASQAHMLSPSKTETKPQRPALKVLKAWPESVSLQGASCWGAGLYGLAQGGVLDPVASEVANGMLGNPKHAVILELMLQPARFQALQPMKIAVAGGGLELYIAGQEVASWQVYELKAGTIIELLPSLHVTGYTSYLAVAGGFKLAEQGDGESKQGAYFGRYLQQGDELELAQLQAKVQGFYGKPRYPQQLSVRIYPGPQFTQQAFQQLCNKPYQIEVMNRMGARLKGESIVLEQHDVPSEGSPWGAIQVPANGQPIVLLNDRGRTGGYAKPAVCDVRDLWKLAQAKPGTHVWFQA